MTSTENAIFEAPASSYVVPEARVFTYPTRLADTYAPECLEIVKPALAVCLPRIRIAALRGRSSSLPGYRTLTMRRRLYMSVAPKLHIEDAILLDLRYESDNNISHLVTFAAPAALLAKSRVAKPIKVVLKARTSELSKRVFEALGFEYLCTDQDVVGTFLLGSNGHDRAYEAMYSRLFSAHFCATPPLSVPDRIFISRRDRRRLANEDEIQAALSKVGFQTLYFEDYPVAQQWGIARSARVIVALHGAALSSLVFAQPSVRVVEIFHPGFTVDFFRRLTHIAGGQWCGITGKPPPDLFRRIDNRSEKSAYLFHSTELHLATLRRALEWIGLYR